MQNNLCGLECLQENHDQAKIYFFCLNSQCKFKRNGCYYCAQENHKSHLQDCFMMNSIQQILENETHKLKTLLKRLNDFLNQISDLGQKILNQILQFTKLLDQNDFSEIDETINITLQIYDNSIVDQRRQVFQKAICEYEQLFWQQFESIHSENSMQYQAQLCKNQCYLLLNHNQIEQAIIKLNQALKLCPNDQNSKRTLELIQNFRKIDCNVVSPADMLKQTIQRKLLCFNTNFDWLSEQKIINFILKILNIRQCNSENELNKLWNQYLNYYKECLLNDDQNVQDNLEFTFMLALFNNYEQGIKIYEQKIQQQLQNCHLMTFCKTILMVVKNPEQLNSIFEYNKKSLNLFLAQISPFYHFQDTFKVQNLFSEFYTLFIRAIQKLHKIPFLKNNSNFVLNNLNEDDCSFEIKQQNGNYPQDFQHYYLLCINLMDQYKLKELRQFSNLAIKQFPQQSVFYFFQAYCLILQEQYEGVLDLIDLDYQKTRGKDLLFLKGYILYKKQKYLESLKIFAQLNSQSNFDYYKQMQGILSFQLGQKQEALIILTNAYMNNKDNEQALHNYCVILFLLDGYDEAINCLNQNKQNNNSLLLKAYCLILQRNFEEAENTLEFIDMLHNKQALCLYALNLSEQKKFNEAEHVFNFLLQSCEYSQLLTRHGYNLIKNEKIQQAKIFFRKMIENGYEQESCQLFLCYILFDLKEYDELQESLEQLFKLNPNQQGGIVELYEYLKCREFDDELNTIIKHKIQQELIESYDNYLKIGFKFFIKFDDDFEEIRHHFLSQKWIGELSQKLYSLE